MRRKRSERAIFLSCAFIVLTALGTSGCGGTTVSLPTQSFAFALDAGEATAMLQDYLDSESVPLDLSQLPDNLLPDLIAGQPLEIKKEFVIEIPPQDLDISNNESIKKYVDKGLVKSVDVKFINYVLETNSLTFDLPQVELYMDDLGATEIGETSKKVGVVPSVKAGTTGNGEVQFTVNGRDTISDFLLKFKMSFLGKALVGVDTSKTRTIPSGKLEGKVEVGVDFTVDPL